MYPAPRRLLSVFFLLNFSVWGSPGLSSPFPTHLHSDFSLPISPGPNPTPTEPTLTSQCTTCRLYQPPSRPFAHSICLGPPDKGQLYPPLGTGAGLGSRWVSMAQGSGSEEKARGSSESEFASHLPWLFVNTTQPWRHQLCAQQLKEAALTTT